MAIFSYSVLALIGIAISVISVFFFYRIRQSLHQGLEVRETLSQELTALPLSKMLVGLGLNINHYLFQVPISQIYKHMITCAACESDAQCNECLKQSSVDPEQITFCPNQASLREYVQQQRAEA